jgi:Domain of unknown function (DUF4386)
MKNNGNESSLYRIGVLAASLAALALLIGGVALAISGSANTANVDQLLTVIDQKWLILTIGYVAIVLISLFDIFTIPGLYTALRRDSNTLVVIAAITAVVGDLFCVIGGLIQTALLPLGTRLIGASSAISTVLFTSAETVVVLESIFSTAGFLLVGVSFSCFGLAILRGTFGKWIGWVAIAAGIFSILGQIPSLAVLFMVANFAYLLWYIGIGTRFNRLATKA